MATYTTARGRTYEFDVRQLSNGYYRPYIVRQPSYGSRDTSSVATHRLKDETNKRLYVCWTKPIRSESEAMKVAAGWAKRTDVYLDTGDTGVWRR